MASRFSWDGEQMLCLISGITNLFPKHQCAWLSTVEATPPVVHGNMLWQVKCRDEWTWRETEGKENGGQESDNGLATDGNQQMVHVAQDPDLQGLDSHRLWLSIALPVAFLFLSCSYFLLHPTGLLVTLFIWPHSKREIYLMTSERSVCKCQCALSLLFPGLPCPLALTIWSPTCQHTAPCLCLHCYH